MTKKRTSKDICQDLTDGCVQHLTPVLVICGKGSIAYSPSHKAKKLSLSIAEGYALHLAELAQAVTNVHNLLSPEIWERYSFYDSEFQKECEEVVLINRRKKEFLEAWQKRPGVLRKCHEVIT